LVLQLLRLRPRRPLIHPGCGREQAHNEKSEPERRKRHKNVCRRRPFGCVRRRT
jgi:hypothetical protein